MVGQRGVRQRGTGQRGAGRPTLELPPEQLRRTANPATLGFQTTSNLPPPPHMVGQARAQEAIDFSLEMLDSRYNLFVAGEPGTGRQTAVMVAVERVAHTRPAPQDWCYVHNFEQPDEPRAIALPAGQARPFARDVESLVQSGRRELRRIFTSEVYSRQSRDLTRDVVARGRRLREIVATDARRLGFAVEFTSSGVGIATLRPVPGDTGFEHAQPYSREEYEALPPSVREEYERNRDRVHDLLDSLYAQLQALREEERSLVSQLDREKAEAVLLPRLEALERSYSASAGAVEHLRAIAKDLLANIDQLSGTEAENPDSASEPSRVSSRALGREPGREPDEGQSSVEESQESEESGDMPVGNAPLGGVLRRCLVNVFVAHKADGTAPIVHEINPTRTNLAGRIEEGRRPNGLPYSDHLMLKPGALHRATGGFLVLQASDVIHAHTYDVLNRVLRFGTLSFDLAEMGRETGGPGSSMLRPQPIPAEVRVILIGDLDDYIRLLVGDPEFSQIFKVRADFDSQMPRNPEGEAVYAQYAGHVARTTGAVPLDAEAVALIIEEGSRWAEDQQKLSAHFGSLRELTMETCHWAAKDGSRVATRTHVAQAIMARERRLSLESDKHEEAIARGKVQIAIDGAVVGQINGLTVVVPISFHDFAFGNPSRITARTSPGQSGIVDIEREVGVGGPLHNKGILILNGYLLGRFAQQFPLSLSATLTFEQSHSLVEGDSASAAELCALLSSLAGVPIKQSLAMTGAVTQLGQIEIIGGVNHKVEAFFRVCRARQLTGEQGVILPRTNVGDLMLRDDVVEAVRAGQFHLYAVSTVDEAMELLTGMPAGQADRHGNFPENSVNGRVLRTLKAYTARVRAYAPSPNGVLRRGS